MYFAASSSALPPISPTIIMASVSESLLKSASISTNEDPGIGSPPIPTHELCPRPKSVVCLTASYVRVPDLEIIPIRPFL